MQDLIAPHGGLSEPVDCTVPDPEVAEFKNRAASLKRVPVSDADLSSLYRLGDGGLSPLSGPMDRETFDRVLDEEVILLKGKAYAWTIPISLSVKWWITSSRKFGAGRKSASKMATYSPAASFSPFSRAPAL